MTDAIAHAILTFAMTSSAVQGTDKGSANATNTTRHSADPTPSSRSKHHDLGGPWPPQSGSVSHVESVQRCWANDQRFVVLVQRISPSTGS